VLRRRVSRTFFFGGARDDRREDLRTGAILYYAIGRWDHAAVTFVVRLFYFVFGYSTSRT